MSSLAVALAAYCLVAVVIVGVFAWLMWEQKKAYDRQVRREAFDGIAAAERWLAERDRIAVERDMPPFEPGQAA